MSVSPFVHPWLAGVFGDESVSSQFSGAAQIDQMRRVEIAYVQAMAAIGAMDQTVSEAASKHIRSREISPDILAASTAKDGVVVPGFVRLLREGATPEISEAIHSGLTSQDVIDSALVLTLQQVNGELESRLVQCLDRLDELTRDFGQVEISGRTRMQLAEPIQAKTRIHAWSSPLRALSEDFPGIKRNLYQLQLGGAVGDRTFWDGNGDKLAAKIAEILGLNAPKHSWHTDRGTLVDYANWLSRVNGALGKIGQDIALMSQQGIDEIKLSGGGGSSAMPHKQNPVLAESLVTLARFNATQIAGMHQSLIHEQERSGAAWSLEWMILPQMVCATMRGLSAADEMLNSVKQIGNSG